MELPADQVQELEPEKKNTLDVLWNEYRYRHDLCWQLIIRLTGVVIFVAVLPYAYSDIAQQHGRWVSILPILAFLISLASIFIIYSECRVLDRIRKRYRKHQNKWLTITHPESTLPFNSRVLIYFICLSVLAILNAAYYIWRPQTTGAIQQPIPQALGTVTHIRTQDSRDNSHYIGHSATLFDGYIYIDVGDGYVIIPRDRLVTAHISKHQIEKR